MHRPARIWLEGCLPKLQNWLNNNFIYVGTIMFIIAIVQVLISLITSHKIFYKFSVLVSVLPKIYVPTSLLNAQNGTIVKYLPVSLLQWPYLNFSI